VPEEESQLPRVSSHPARPPGRPARERKSRRCPDGRAEVLCTEPYSRDSNPAVRQCNDL